MGNGWALSPCALFCATAHTIAEFTQKAFASIEVPLTAEACEIAGLAPQRGAKRA